jgi:hypothetical protein
LRQLTKALFSEGKHPFPASGAHPLKSGICRADRGWMGRFLPPGGDFLVPSRVPRRGRGESPPGRVRLRAARAGLIQAWPELAPVLRFIVRTHRAQRGTMLKTNKISRPYAQAITLTPAESAGPRVSLCRVEA